MMISSLFSSFRSRYRNSIEQRTASLDPNVRDCLSNEIEQFMLLPSTESSTEEHNNNSIDNGSDGDVEFGKLICCDDDGNNSNGAGGPMTIPELEATLLESRAKLEKCENAQQFVESRLNSYRKALIEQRRRIKQMEKHCDEERQLLERHAYGGDTTIITQEGDEDGDEVHVFTNKPTRSSSMYGQSSVSMTDTTRLSLRIQKMTMKYEQWEAQLQTVEESYRSLTLNVAGMRDKISHLEQVKSDILERQDECREFVIAAAMADTNNHQ